MRRVILVLMAVVFAGSAYGAPETQYFALFLEGAKSGHAVYERKVEDGKVFTTEKVNLTMNRAGMVITIETRETHIETVRGEPLGFEMVQNLGGMGMQVSGKVTQDGKLEMTTDSLGMQQQRTMDWPAGAVMSEGLRLLERKHGLKEDSSFEAKIFAASVMDAVDALVQIGPTRQVDLLGRVVELTEVTTVMNLPMGGGMGGAAPESGAAQQGSSGMKLVSTSYVDDDLMPQKMEVPVAGMHIEMVACPKEFALSGDAPVDLVDRLMVQSPVSLAGAADADSIIYHLTATANEQVRLPETDNQQVREDGSGGLFVKVAPVEPAAGVRFPYRGTDKRALEALKPTRYLQTDSEEIIRLAREAVGDTKDAAEAVRRIERYVSRYIQEKDLSVGYASAVEVARSRQGDCSEHAVLTAAMCRAVGIPAEVVTGIVYVEEFGGRRDVFGGHAWAQAYVGGKWVGLDATGQGPRGFTATHITQASGNGNPEDFFALVGSMGTFEIAEVRVNQ